MQRPNEEPMRTGKQEMQLQQPVGNSTSKEKTKQKPRVAISEPLNPNGLFVKLNCHAALALIDLETMGEDIICAQFVHFYKLAGVKIQPETIATGVKGYKGTVDTTQEIEHKWRR